MDWFPWYPTDFRRKTYRLSLAEDGAYRRLIDEYMITREPLPNDDGALARILGISKAEWECLAPRVRPYFRARNDQLVHKRCEEELRAQDLRHNRNSERAKKAAFARYSKIKGLPAQRMLVHATLHNKEITPTVTGAEEGAADAERVASPRPISQPSAIDVTPELARINQRKGWTR